MECNNYYLENKNELIKLFRDSKEEQNEVLCGYFETQKTEYWLNEAKKTFIELIPNIPDIGGHDNIMLPFLTYSSVLMPIAKILKNERFDTRIIGQAIFEMMEGIYNRIPMKNRLILNREYYLDSNIDKWRKHAEESHKKKYDGDWVLNFIKGKNNFLYGLDMTECALFKFWKSQDLEELVPYLCLMDWAYWKTVGIRVKRTKTIANGGGICNYRYLGRSEYKNDCPSGWPPETMEEWTGKYEK